jgi:hypothetical protein
MLNRINISKIIKDHFLTLKSNKTGKVLFSDIFIFFGAPFLASFFLVRFSVLLDKDIVNLLITIFSIFVGLLFNLLLLIFDISEKLSFNKNQNVKTQYYSKVNNLESKREKFLKSILHETYVNISFCILLSILDICILLLFFISKENHIFVSVISLFSYFPLFVFILTLIMILKRVYILLSEQMEDG